MQLYNYEVSSGNHLTNFKMKRHESYSIVSCNMNDRHYRVRLHTYNIARPFFFVNDNQMKAVNFTTC
jgi:hypothetical protein